jgi:hypothetical protein
MSKQTKIIAIIGGVLIAGALVVLFVGGKPPAETTQQRGVQTQQ